MFGRERASSAFGHDWTRDFTSVIGLRPASAFRNCEDGIIGPGNFRLASICPLRICRCVGRPRPGRHLLPFVQVMQAGPFDGADMDEHIGLASVRLNCDFGSYKAEIPPVILIAWPVIFAAAGDARKTTRPASSSLVTTPSPASRDAFANILPANGSAMIRP
jgi:hypothetical protein